MQSPKEQNLSEILKVFETVPSSYLILSPELFILTASNIFLDAADLSREAIQGKYLFDVFLTLPILKGGDSTQTVKTSLEEVILTRLPHYMQIQQFHVSSSDTEGTFYTHYRQLSHTPVLDNDGEIVYIIQNANDIKEEVLKLAKRLVALEEDNKISSLDEIQSLNLKLDKMRSSELEHENSLQSFNHLADLVPAKVSYALPNGKVVYFNKHWLDYSGMSFLDLKDFGYHQLMHPDEIEPFQTGLQEAVESGSPFESKLRFRDRSGGYRWHLNIASPIFDDEGEIVMWSGATTDIQSLMDEELRKTDFIGMVSHELKTPLTSIKAYLQLLNLKMAESDDDMVGRAINNSLDQIKKMMDMVDGFMSTSRLESSKIVLKKTGFGLSDLINEIREDIEYTVNSHKIIFRGNNEVTTVKADRQRIEQVIKNLISNGVKYSEKGTEIVCGYTVSADEIRFTVSDSGQGIDPIHQDKIFQLYYRVESDMSVTTSGFGIGLYFCSQIIEAHEGRIWVESELGKGSSFHFIIPRFCSAKAVS